MDQGPDCNFREDIAAALDWWREAGVDCAFSEEVTPWLAPPEASDERGSPGESAVVPTAPSRPAPPEIAAIGGEFAYWPDDLATFHQWWLSEPSLDDGQVEGRVPPRGETGAELMVIVPQPEAEDGENLLSGPQGRLLEAMLAAMGIDMGTAYVASALPRHMPMADWARLADAGLGRLLAHHIALAAPTRIIVFGDNVPPLLGHNPTQKAAFSQPINQGIREVPLLAARNLATMLDRPAGKAAFWQQWLEWTTTD